MNKNNKKKETKNNLDEWTGEVSKHFANLSQAEIKILAMFSFAMAIVGSSGLTTCVGFLAVLLGFKENNVRQRLKEFYKGKEDKSGKKRAELEVKKCFPSLIKWILSQWEGTDKRIAIALDATTLGQKFTVLTVATVYRGLFLPIAWTIVPACKKGAWRPLWLELLKIVGPHIPEDWTVIVLTDRGLYAKWLYKGIKEQGWHPFMRINKQGHFRRKGRKQFEPLANFIKGVGSNISMKGTCFKTNSLSCTVLIKWEEGYEDAWIIVTDLGIKEAEAVWYGLRPWIECGFKDFKRGGFQWQYTRMEDPKRAERLWLVMAVAMIWLVSVGTEAEDGNEETRLSGLEEYPEDILVVGEGKSRRSRAKARWLSCFRRGFVTLLAKLIAGCKLPLGYLKPEPWPSEKNIIRLKEAKGGTVALAA